jgi:[acyl-carrier-protein] S-malonyltransferase
MPEKIAFLFPGQGSQRVGMGSDICEKNPVAKNVLLAADEALGRSISSLCFNGPDEELMATYNTQPAIVSVSYALAAAAMEAGLKPSAVAGHSVGEYAALAVAGVLPFERLVELVALRGQLMDEACPQGTGSMAALIGLDEETTRELISTLDLEDEILDVAGLNNPGQVVVAGHVTALEKANAKVKDFGGRRGMMLKVSGPFHSRLMKPAEDGLAKELEQCDFDNAHVPVVPNVLADFTQDPEELKRCLMSQLTKPVMWEKSILAMRDAGIRTFVEFGTGNVLSGMIKKIDKELEVYTVSDAESCAATVKELLG